MTRILSRTLALSLLAIVLAMASGTKQPAPGPEFGFVPTQLRNWIPWVMESLGDSACPGDDDDSRLCAALSRLEVRADKSGANFVLTGRRYSKGEVTLPGDSSAWPFEVQDGAARIPVIGDPTDKPFVERPTGPFRITGRLKWRKRPSSLTIPDDVAVKSLTVDGKVAAWDPEGNRMWLEEKDETDESEGDDESTISDTVESLQIRVFRLLTDGSPMTLTTTMQLVVGGKERRLSLNSILPVNSRPLSMTSALAGRLDAKGGMELTLRPGTWQVEVKSALQGTPSTLASSVAPYPWPAEEVWSFQESPSFRALSLEGAPPVDPDQAGLDPSRRDLPTWSLDRNHPLSVKVTRMGSLDPDSLKIDLARRLWIDADGRGATIREVLDIQTARPMRLSIYSPIEPGRIMVNGSARLITSNGPGELGVNLHFGQRNVDVQGRVSDGNWHSLPIASTRIRPTRARIEVSAPPGWWVLHLSGPSGSEANSTWISHWTLKECLWAIALAALLYFALGRIGSILALGMCVAGAHDGIAIESWLALGIVLGARKATVKFLPRLEPKLGAATPALFVVLAWCAWSSLGFSVDQWTRIVHPSARISDEVSSLGRLLRGELMLSKKAAAPLMDETALLLPAQQPAGNSEGATEVRTIPSTPSASAVMSQSVMDKVMAESDGLLGEDVDPNQSHMIDAILAGNASGARSASPGKAMARKRALGGEEADMRRSSPVRPAFVPQPVRDPFLEGSIQTGPGIPSSNGELATLESSSWPGLDAHVGIWTASTGWVRLIRLLGIAICWMLAAMAWREIGWTKIVVSTESKIPVLPLGILLLLPMAAKAQDAFPNESMLGELKAKLVRSPSCGTNCADISHVRVVASGSEIRTMVTVNAMAKTSIWLPRGDWELSDIRCDDCTIGAQGSDPWAIVDKGIHTVTMTARASGGDLVVSFPVRPRLLETETPGWTRQDGGRASLHLTKNGHHSAANHVRETDEEAPEKPRKNPGAVPFVEIERNFEFLREWTVTTQLIRSTQFEGAIAITYPLLAGETSLDGQASDSGKAHWVLPAGTNSVTFKTRLRHDDTLVLKATEGPWSETWRAAALDRFQVMATGLPPIGRGDLAWKPFPGDHLFLSIKAHPAAKGAIATIHSASLVWNDDPQSSKGSLDITPEASQATELKIKLPDGARLGTTISNGRILSPSRLPDGRWSLPLVSNSNNIHLEWMAEPNRSFLRHAPGVELSIPGVNFRTAMTPGADRFAIAAGGSGDGTFAAWWAFLPFFVLAAFAFSRWTEGAIGLGSALLAIIPFTTIAGVFGRVGLLSIVLLFFLLRWRGRQNPSNWTRQRFFFVQLEIGLVAAIAAWSFVRLLLVPLLGGPDFGLTDSTLPWTWVLVRSNGALPSAWIFELPLWAWKVAMALWGVHVLRTAIPWIKKGWSRYGQGGFWPTMNTVIDDETPETPPSKPQE